MIVSQPAMKAMKAILSNDYGSIQNLHLVTDYIHPALDNKNKTHQIPKGKLLIKTQAVAIAPGDVRVLSGVTRELQGPPSFPYIPGGDLCGTIVDMNMDMKNDSTEYKLGDRIAARFTDGPRGALGEYTLVNPKMASKVPSNLSSEEGAALASSATVALCLSRRISPQEKVLIMGCGGGVGSHLCQLLRIKGVKCIAAASHDPERMKKEPFLCDYVLDYSQKDVYDLKEWNKVGVPLDEMFDTVIDLSGGGWLRLMEHRRTSTDDTNAANTNANTNANAPDTTTTTTKMIVKAAKDGGRYLTLVPDVYNFELHSIWQAMKLFLFANMYRHVTSRSIYRATLPAHTFAMSLDNDVEIMKETLKLASENKLKACIDDRGPFEFTTEGVQQAFELQASRHVRGKVVVTVLPSGDDEPAAAGGLKNPQGLVDA